jgi:hypothetical protein
VWACGGSEEPCVISHPISGCSYQMLIGALLAIFGSLFAYRIAEI